MHTLRPTRPPCGWSARLMARDCPVKPCGQVPRTEGVSHTCPPLCPASKALWSFRGGWGSRGVLVPYETVVLVAGSHRSDTHPYLLPSIPTLHVRSMRNQSPVADLVLSRHSGASRREYPVLCARNPAPSQSGAGGCFASCRVVARVFDSGNPLRAHRSV